MLVILLGFSVDRILGAVQSDELVGVTAMVRL